MRRFRRILLNATTALSLLLCVATAVLWAGSNTTSRFLSIRCAASNQRGNPVKWVTLESTTGRLVASALSREPTPSKIARDSREFLDEFDREYGDSPRLRSELDAKPEYPAEAGRFGFGYAKAWVSGTGGVYERRRTVFPHWAAMIVLATPGLLTWIFHRHRVRRLGVCVNCGYDLRATPERCPECGQVPAGR